MFVAVNVYHPSGNRLSDVARPAIAFGSGRKRIPHQSHFGIRRAWTTTSRARRGSFEPQQLLGTTAWSVMMSEMCGYAHERGQPVGGSSCRRKTVVTGWSIASNQSLMVCPTPYVACRSTKSVECFVDVERDLIAQDMVKRPRNFMRGSANGDKAVCLLAFSLIKTFYGGLKPDHEMSGFAVSP